MHISHCHQRISQGSIATYFRCGGIFRYNSVANLPVSRSVKKIKYWLTFLEVMGKFSVLFFKLTVYISLTGFCTNFTNCQCMWSWFPKCSHYAVIMHIFAGMLSEHSACLKQHIIPNSRCPTAMLMPVHTHDHN